MHSLYTMRKSLFLVLILVSAFSHAGEDKSSSKTFKSYPVDASVTKDKFRWLAQAGAQRLVSATQITISSFSIMYQKKKGVKVKVVVVNSTTGKKVKTAGPFAAKADEEATSWDVDYLSIDLALSLQPGSYFIYPELLEGKLGYLPNYNRLNRVDNRFKIYPGMFINDVRGEVWEYKFDEKDVKSESKLNDYGPFLKWVLVQEASPIAENDTARIRELIKLVGKEGQKEELIPNEITKEFAEMNKKIEANPGSKSALNGRGAANSNIGNYSAAIRDFTVAIDLDSSDVVAITNRGITYAKMGEYKLALIDFDEAITFDNTDPLIYYTKGFVERQLGLYNEAVNDFSKAAAFNPRDELTYYMRARTKMDQKDYNGALEDFDKALVVNPNYWAVFKYRAKVYEEQGDFIKAIDDYTTSLSLNEKDSTIYIFRANIYEKLKKDSLAAHDYKEVLILEKDNLPILQKMGEACVRAGMNTEAVAAFDHLLTLDPTYYDAYYFRGVAKFQLGEMSNACGDWTIAQHKPTQALEDAIKNHCGKYDTKLK
jgi:tetratricopeptide (TPR) repeat protein